MRVAVLSFYCYKMLLALFFERLCDGVLDIELNSIINVICRSDEYGCNILNTSSEYRNIS